MRIIKSQPRNPGDREVVEAEPLIEDIQFNIHKFTNRQRPNDRRKILILCNFSEFGCEIIGTHYCIPRILDKLPGQYVVAVGWFGREFLYRHLVDEYWELKEDYQWLRNYAMAFHHHSCNLLNMEYKLEGHGRVFRTKNAGIYCLFHQCHRCGKFFQGNLICPKCKSTDVLKALFADVQYWKPHAVRVPQPSAVKLAKAESLLKPKSVAIFARARKTYGRNLPPDFYIELIHLLERMGYNPIWLGERVSTLPCPVSHITDISQSPDHGDLELNLGIVSKCEFTIQYWTASTRLAAMMGVPYLLFESPDQIWGGGHEGYRRALCAFGPSKLVVSHYENVRDNQVEGLRLTEQAVQEMQQGNYEDIFGLLETEIAAQTMKKENQQRIEGINVTNP